MSTETEQLYRLHYKVIAPLIMGQGTGDGITTACVMAQAATIDALRRGQTLDRPTDQMECACPLLRRFAININDANWWKSDAERAKHLRPLIPLLLDSRGSVELTKRRAAHWTDVVVRVLTPMRLEAIAKRTKFDQVREKVLEGASTLRSLAAIADEASARKAQKALAAYMTSALSAYSFALDADFHIFYSFVFDADNYVVRAVYDYISYIQHVDACSETSYSYSHSKAYAYACACIPPLQAQKRAYRDLCLATFRSARP